jgi:hypothetical protein
MVTHYRDSGTGIDPESIQQLDIPDIEIAPPEGLDLGGPEGLDGLEPPPDLAPPADLQAPGP